MKTALKKFDLHDFYDGGYQYNRNSSRAFLFSFLSLYLVSSRRILDCPKQEARQKSPEGGG
jgi:hypothetical protein